MTQMRHTSASAGNSTERFSRPAVPAQIQAPVGEEVALLLHASGSQIYICQKGNDGTYSWALKAPEADLRSSDGTAIGSHFAGPTWKLNDGSQVIAKLAARVDVPEPGAIPWLLLTVTSNSGQGRLSRVTSIQRINTNGGLPPAGDDCTAATQGTEVKVPYTADYYFFAAAK